MGYFGIIVVFDIKVDFDVEQLDEKVLIIVCEESKVIVVGWSYFSKYIIVGYEDGSVFQYDGKMGDFIYNVNVYEFGFFIIDFQWNQDCIYFIIVLKDKSVKVMFFVLCV